jgi:uncharacterized membrane protein YozB (DUF420 family)
MSSQAFTADGGSRHGFYLGIAVVIAITTFVGFAPTFYLKGSAAAPSLSPLIWAHGLLFTAWIALLVTQVTLVAKDRVDLHRRLGMFGVALAGAMVPVGILTAIYAALLGHVPPGAPPPLVFMAIPLFAMVEFAILAGAAIALRANTQAHKRLMLLATIAILGAAIARLPLPFAGTPPGFFAIGDLFILACVIHDWRSLGRVHPVYVWGGSLIVVFQPIQLMCMQTGAWMAFAKWLTGG